MTLRALFAAIGVTFVLAATAHAQAVSGLDGRWEGRIAMPSGATLAGVFRVETKEGKTTAFFDSPDQGAAGIPASVTREGDKVTFQVPSALITYAATLSADGKTLTGRMTQGASSIAVTMTQTPAAAAAPPLTGPAVAGLDGRWEGVLSTPNGSLTLVLRIATAGEKTTTLMDSPDQGATGIPAVAARTGQKVTIDVPGVSGTYAAELSADGKTLTGSWTQVGQSFPLSLARK
ncbi:MAG: hypothetical protein ACHP7N_16310 [Caulobacterales bacterium]